MEGQPEGKNGAPDPFQHPDPGPLSHKLTITHRPHSVATPSAPGKAQKLKYSMRDVPQLPLH